VDEDSWRHVEDRDVYIDIAVEHVLDRLDAQLARQTWIELLRHCPSTLVTRVTRILSLRSVSRLC